MLNTNRATVTKIAAAEASITPHPTSTGVQPAISLPHHIWYGRGKMLTQQCHYEAALASFDTALKFLPDVHQIWIYRGIVLTHLRHYESALASFAKATEIMPQSREAWIFQGAVLTYLDRPQEAIDSYTTALSLQEQSSAIYEDYPMWGVIPAVLERAG
ncbi:MAG: tetratricopeptide repeat protein [Kovacikia sp.]